MNYTIVKDEYKLKEFIDWLPELTEDECFYVALFARKKYHDSAKNDKSQCKRFTATSTEWLYRKIKQLEIPKGLYTNKDGSAVHEDALALYISINPRSLRLAKKYLAMELVDKQCDLSNHQNPSSMALSQIQKSKSRTVYVDFDFDTKTPYSTVGQLINMCINRDAYVVINTRGGFHLLVDPNKVEDEYKHTWHRELSEFQGVDVSGDILLPVVGCCQGGFTPYFEEL